VTSDSISRRGVLSALTATGAAAAGLPGAMATDPVADDNFEEREWGYVHQEFEPPPRTAAILEKDGYTGASTQRPPTHYLRMRDGVLLAVAVHPPERNSKNDHILVRASIRGTGCSGGQFNLFDRTHAKDGREVIEWIADRPWALDRVGLFGSSYGAITALLVATAQPPSLAALMAIKGLGDVYRDIAYPGGIGNAGFPVAWSAALRPAMAAQGSAEGIRSGDRICAENTATRPPQDPRDAAATWATYPMDGPRYRVRSAIEYADRIDVPTYLAYGMQDEQTGPRGNPNLFHELSPEPASPPGTPPGLDPLHEEPKLLRVVNGYHATVASDPRGWFDYWLRGEETGIMDEPPVRVRTGVNTDDAEVAWEMDSFLQPDVDWTRFYLGEAGSLSRTAPDSEGTDRYVTGSPRQSWVFSGGNTGSEVLLADGPDVLTYRSPAFETPTRIAGPITATLHASTTTPGTDAPLRGTSTDFFVRVADEFPDGSVVPLQRGVLRATHRQLDEERTLYNDDGEIVRPYHPHTNRETILPGKVYRYDIEVWPLAHLLREGHRLVVRIHSPPATDGIWSYEPLDTPGVNTIHRSSEYPSSVLFPLQEWPENEPLPPKQDCGQPEGYRCVSGYDSGVGVEMSDPV
jgi:putative CocE/NonD family hydrolase